MAFSPSLVLYRLFGNRVSSKDGLATNLGTGGATRPKGQLIWLHSPSPGDHPVTLDLLNSISDDHPDCWFIATTEGHVFENLPSQVIFQVIQSDRPKDADAFLEHWHPDVVFWLSDHLLPTLILETAKRQIPLILLDTGAAIQTTRSTWFLPGLTRRTLHKFDTVLSGDEATSLALISAGARPDVVKTTGVLELAVSPPPVNDAEWSTLAALVATRPIWLAAKIQFDDLESVLTAHFQATRRTHRLLLIIVPADISESSQFSAALGKRGFLYSTRSEGEEPENDIQVYLADTDDEMGLWYRLAPLSFLGPSRPETDASKIADPLQAAALGSVVLNCPPSGPHDVSYQRLLRAGASRQISHIGELGHALETVLAPDRAAVMAHAAWQITSLGAEALEAALSTLDNILNTPKRGDK